MKQELRECSVGSKSGESDVVQNVFAESRTAKFIYQTLPALFSRAS